MRNISFDNPYLLLIAVPLLLAVIIPYAIAIRKDNASKSVIASLILHLVMVCCITLSAAGLTHTTVMTETHVYVVADLSYSSSRQIGRINGLIEEVEDELPSNSELGVVCFGRNQVVNTDVGGSFRGVSTDGVDESASDIAAALNFTAGLFEQNVIKRIVLITDGNETGTVMNGGLLAAVENMHLKDIAIDAIYLDTNIAEGVDEVQITEVNFTPHTYKAHTTTADVLVQSNKDTTAIVKLTEGGEVLSEKAEPLTKGYNVINFPLNTAQEGTYDYCVEIASEGDVTAQNNAFRFTQQVEDTLEVLLLTRTQADLDRASELYGERARITAPLVPNEQGKTSKLPYSVEELCFYDEILISNLDVSTIDNRLAFMTSLDQVVSRFGKSLVTIGDTNIQNMGDEDVALENLANMLPVKFGNSEREPKLYAIVLDISHSMSFTNKLQFTRAKKAAKYLLDLLGDQDYAVITPFWGENEKNLPLQMKDPKTGADNRQTLVAQIDGFTVKQGTSMGAAMQATYDMLAQQTANYGEMQVYLITDGLTSNADLAANNPVTMASKYYRENNIATSTIYAQRGSKPETEEGTDNLGAIKRLEDVAKAAGGAYYRITDDNVDHIMLNQVAPDLTESVVEGGLYEVDVQRETDAVMKDVYSLPQIKGYVNSKAKASATTVLTTKYERKEATATEAAVYVDVPVYAYWDYGEGRVSTFTSSLNDDWSSAWATDERANVFLKNVLTVNTPQEKNGSPYTLSVTPKGMKTEVEILPVSLNPYATVEVEITTPSGETIEQLLTFDSQKYSYEFNTSELGRYAIKVVYTDPDLGLTFHSSAYFNLSYDAEYNSFATSDISNLKDAIRNRGTVYTDGKVDLVDEDAEVSTYEAKYAVPLLIAAVALYVVDIVVRKMKIEDFKMLFRRKNKGGKRQ